MFGIVPAMDKVTRVVRIGRLGMHPRMALTAYADQVVRSVQEFRSAHASQLTVVNVIRGSQASYALPIVPFKYFCFQFTVKLHTMLARVFSLLNNERPISIRLSRARTIACAVRSSDLPRSQSAAAC